MKDYTYLFLLDCMDRYLNNWTMEQNRAVQDSDHLRQVKTFSATWGQG